MATRGEVASTTLIEAAERLFAERGIESVSLRDISAAAGQRNHSAAQYHFGDRAGLVAAVFDHRMRDVNERRHRLLDGLEAQDRGDLDGFVDATVRPLVEVVEETGGWYARFLVRARWDTFAQAIVADAEVLSSFRRVVERILGCLDGPFDERVDRVDQMTTLLIGTIAGWEWRGHNGERRPPADALRLDLTSTCRAVLTARAAERTTAGSTR